MRTATLVGLMLAVTVFTACNRNKPAENAAPQAQAANPVRSAQSAPPAAAANADPIDPSKEMPANSLTTNATLEAEKESTVIIDGRSDIFSAGLNAADPDRG